MRIQSGSMSETVHPQIIAFEKRLSSLGISRPDMYLKMGIYKEKYGNWRKRGIPKGQTFKAAKIAKCDPEALGKGKIAPIENQELSSSLPDSKHNLKVKSYYNIEPDIERGEDVPLIACVSAGEFEEIIDNFQPGFAEDWYMRPKKGGSRTVAMRVKGDSMTASYGKSYPDGCIIFIDPDKRTPENGERIIAKVSGDDLVNFKQFARDGGDVFLRALNTNYPPITKEFEVLGTVVGKWEDE